MSAFKPMAGLTSGLLARKGAARPAMRSQLFASLQSSGASAFSPPDLEDLGWNDMGNQAYPPNTAFDQESPAAEARAIETPVPPFEEFAIKRIRFAPGTSLLDETLQETECDEVVQTEAQIQVDQASSLLTLSPKAIRETRRAVTVRVTDDRYSQLRDVCHELGYTAQRVLSEALEEWLAARKFMPRN